MAKLPATSMKSLDRYVISFGSLTKIKGFSFKDFEDRAEALELQNPGQGYQLAYQETMTDMFRKILDRHSRYEENVPTLNEFLQYYDDILMKGYFAERKAQKIGGDIKMTANGRKLETFESFKNVMNEHPATSVVNKVNNKFASGEFTLDNTRDMAKAKTKANATPTKAEALELVACATFLEKRNKERSFWSMLISLPTHFKERSAIKAMKALASRYDTIANLKREASKESNGLKALRAAVDDGILIEKDKARPFFDEAVVKEINEGYKDLLDDKAIDESALDNDNILNETLNLEDTDANLTTDNDSADKNLFGDESELEEVHSIEKVEFDEDDIDIFPKDSEPKQAKLDELVRDNPILK